MIIIYGLGCNGAYTAGQCVFVECALCLQSLFQQTKTNVSFREMARLIARNSLSLENFGKTLQKVQFCINYYDGAKKNEGFVGFEKAFSRAKTYIILMPLNYVHFYARFC